MMINERPVRPSYRTYFIDICNVVASRSTCIRHHVGAIIVKDKRILSTGYNGAPVGLPHCIDIGCPRKDVPSGTMHELCRAVHAEQNAIIQAALHGISTRGATLYCTHQPCILCSKMIINAGIVEVVYKTSYDEKTGLEMLKQSGINVSQYNPCEDIDPEPILVDHPCNGDKTPHTHKFSPIYQYDDTKIDHPASGRHVHKGLIFSPLEESHDYKFTLLQVVPTNFEHGYKNKGLMIDCQNVPIPAWKRLEVRRIEEF